MKHGKPLHAPRVLCEAYDYPKPVPFSRGMRVDVSGATFIFVSGTASVNALGETVHAGDLEKQTRRTFTNIKALLESEGATWRDVVHTRIYLRSMDRYHEFNRYRRAFLDGEGVHPYPASTCVEARLCRDDLLVEIEAIAVCQRKGGRPPRTRRRAPTSLEHPPSSPSPARGEGKNKKASRPVLPSPSMGEGQGGGEGLRGTRLEKHPRKR